MTVKESMRFKEKGEEEMCHIVKIDTEQQLARVIARGKVNVLELMAIYKELIRHDDWQAGFDILCDYRGIENFDVSTRDIDEIAEWQSSIDKKIGSGKCAVVASRDSVFGMSRMWEMISADRSQRICVFREMDDAVSWLGVYGRETFQCA
jgi:hypothetical protein